METAALGLVSHNPLQRFSGRYHWVSRSFLALEAATYQLSPALGTW